MIKSTTHTDNEVNKNLAEVEKKNKDEACNTVGVQTKPAEQKETDEQCVTKADKRSDCSS